MVVFARSNKSMELTNALTLCYLSYFLMAAPQSFHFEVALKKAVLQQVELTPFGYQ
jgi:hypothetical protein